MPESKFTPTGKLCTSCHQRKADVFVELDSMCLNCYERLVVAYNRLRYEHSKSLVSEAYKHLKYMDSKTREV